MVPLLVGVLAGLLSTVAGMGGGLVLLIALAAWWGDPVLALTASAPALLVGNLHRVALYRKEIAWRLAVPFIAGTVPGALAGAWLAVALPEGVVQVAMLGAACLLLARTFGVWRPRWQSPALVPAGVGVGVVGATAGGAGLIVGPLLLGAGLSGGAYLATASLTAASLHVARWVGYGASGAMGLSTLWLSLGLAVAIAVGNTVGARVRTGVPESWTRRLEVAVAVGAVVIALVALVL